MAPLGSYLVTPVSPGDFEMKRYTSQNRLEVVVRSDQKQWLRQQATSLRSIGDVVRDLIDLAMKAAP